MNTHIRISAKNALINGYERNENGRKKRAAHHNIQLINDDQQSFSRIGIINVNDHRRRWGGGVRNRDQ